MADNGDDPPSAEVELDETVELDEGLDLENWDNHNRYPQNGARRDLRGWWSSLTKRASGASTFLIIGSAYHIGALAAYDRLKVTHTDERRIAFFAYQVNASPLHKCIETARLMNYPVLVGGFTWLLSLCWMIFRVVYSRKHVEPKEIELALIEAEELPDTERPEISSPTPTGQSIASKAANIGLKVLVAIPYVLSFVGLVIILAGIVGMMYVSAHMHPPVLAGNMTVPGLAGPARIEREPNGIIHIYAATGRDAYFAQGVAMAQERLWQMEVQRRAGRGILSEVLGAATLEVDVELRTLGLYRAAQRAQEHLRVAYPEVLEGLQAFADGVNYWIEQGHPLPLEFILTDFKPGPFSAVDGLTMSKLMALDLGMNMRYELARYEIGATLERINQLWPPYPSWAPTIISPSDVNQTLDQIRREGHPMRMREVPHEAQADSSFYRGQHKVVEEERSAWRRFRAGADINSWVDASNNWVISGRHTATGKPILANDPHMSFSSPSIWILMHLHADDGLNAIGSSLPGVPGIVLGRNDHIAWGVTNVGADVQDLYILTEDDENHYLWQGDRVAYQIHTEPIRVKGAEDHMLTIKYSVYGPVINAAMDIDGPPIAFRWVGADDNDTTAVAFSLINRATSYQNWRDALRHFIAPSSNFIFADLEGNIAYQCTGHIPIRPVGDGAYPMESNSSAGALWTGYIPFDQLPHVLNPEEGFIVTANNRVIGPEYPHLILTEKDWEEGYRATRIRTLISDTIARGEHITTDHVKRWQNDQTTVMWSQNLRPILAAFEPTALSSSAEAYRQKLLAWDGNINASSVFALAYEEWFWALADVTRSELGISAWPRPYFVQHVFTKGDASCGTLAQCTAFAVQAFERIAQKYATSTEEFGERHTTLFAQAVLGDGRTPVGCLWDRSVRVGGDSYTVNPSSLSPSTSTYVSRLGASYREIINLAEPEASLFIHPMGQSGSPFSSHFDDFLPMWASGAYLPMRMVGYSVAKTNHLLPQGPVADTEATTTTSTRAASLASSFTTENEATVTAHSTTANSADTTSTARSTSSTTRATTRAAASQTSASSSASRAATTSTHETTTA